MKAVTCDLSDCPASFNILELLSIARTRGFDHVIFDDSKIREDKFSLEDSRRRIDNILVPSCALAGMSYSFGKGNENKGAWGLARLVACYREMGRLELLRSVLPPRDARYTVTIREASRKTYRNSNADAWRAFGRSIGAKVIEDWYVAPIDLHERMAWYAGAEMNFFVSNGPAMLCGLSTIPYCIFEGEHPNAEKYRTTYGFSVGGPFPWAIPGQFMIWEKDAPETIRRVAREIGVVPTKESV